MTPRKDLCCAACDEPVYIVTTGEYQGRLRKVAKCVDGSRQVTFATASGATATVSACANCMFGPETLMYVWRRCSIGPMAKWRSESQRSRELLRQHRDVPIGILKIRPHERLAHSIEGVS